MPSRTRKEASQPLVMLSFTLTKAQKEGIKAAARREGRSVSGWIRWQIHQAGVKDPYILDDDPS